MNTLVASTDGLTGARTILWNLKNRTPGFMVYGACFVTLAQIVSLEQLISNAKPTGSDQNQPKNTVTSPYYTIDAGIILEAVAIAVLNQIGPFVS